MPITESQVQTALRGLVESEQHVVRARLDRAFPRGGLADRCERAHLQIVGHGEPRETKLAPQQVGRDAPRQRRG